MSKEQSMLSASLEACRQRMEKLRYSIDKNAVLFPLTPQALAMLSDAQEESVDAFILRYSQCVSMIQDQLFRGIAYLEQEDISDKSNRDKTLLMEKLGAIKSAEDFGTATMLRNKFCDSSALLRFRPSDVCQTRRRARKQSHRRTDIPCNAGARQSFGGTS